MGFRRPPLLLSLLFVLAASSCKQSVGEQCQVESDCESGLICNQATMTCQERGGGAVDGSIEIDAPIDSPIADAAEADAPEADAPEADAPEADALEADAATDAPFNAN
jgi:hypothetical protein